jgi:hypothetical protein
MNTDKYTEWTKRHHAMMRNGGMWAIPKACLIFMRTPEGFELAETMPYLPEMSEAFSHGADVPASPSALREYQINFFMVIQAHNEAAGLKVTDPKNLLNLS